MNFIYIMVDVDSDQAKLLLSQYNKKECSCCLETIELETYDTLEDNIISNKKLVFIFPIDKHLKCKEFLKRCFDNPLVIDTSLIKLDINEITLETRIKQTVEGLHLDKK